jgi:hypothetical protein
MKNTYHPPHSRVQLSERGKESQIIRQDKPYQHNGLLIGTDHRGHLIVIPDTLETPSTFHPSFWEDEDPEFRRKQLRVRTFNPDYKILMEDMKPGTVVHMTSTCKSRRKIPETKTIRGTLIAWTWKMREGKPIDTIKVIVEGRISTAHFLPEDWEPGGPNPFELEKALSHAIHC